MKDDGRVSDIVISFPFYDVDSVTYKIPDNFKVERLPKEVWLQSEFGEYHQHVVFNAGVLTFVRKYKRLAGRFDKSLYQELVDFNNSINKADKSSVVLVEGN